MNVFKGRTLAVIADLSLDERIYLFEKTRQLKEAISSDDETILKDFRIDNPDFGIYEVFLEDSTRTKESFKNAAKFHRVKVSELDSEHSSFNKKESYADTFNNLAGYGNSIFIIRSKLEGVCRWLEKSGKEYAERNSTEAPCFINGGDGKHEHPTQELLDDFTLLEDNGWDRSDMHLALVGDLYHGRTIHSKVDGLRIFDKPTIDLIAPKEIAMPEYYINKMVENKFRVREFNSIEEYLKKGDTAKRWYFTRPQLERMGEDILKRQDELRSYITFQEKFLDKIKKGTIFYHPLPRHKVHPTIPFFLDNLPLNGWERQSANGKLTRITLLGLFSGKVGHDFEGDSIKKQEESNIDYFIEQIVPKGTGVKEYKEGIRPIERGMVIDHVCRGESKEEIWEHLAKVMKVMDLYGRAYIGVDESKKEKETYKGLISLPDKEHFKEHMIKKLAAVAPGCTLNLIDDEKITKKLRLNTPPKIYGFDEISCNNENCISYPSHNEGVDEEFYRKGNNFICKYCEQPHSFKEIWR